MRKLHSAFSVAVVGMTLAGCVTPEPKTIVVRTDGQRMQNNPKLIAQLEQDRTACAGEAAKAALSAGTIRWQGLAGAIAAEQVASQQREAVKMVMVGCMAGKGYVLRNADQMQPGST
jgi:outer membrane murein-binding lipoprotein Lpp